MACTIPQCQFAKLGSGIVLHSAPFAMLGRDVEMPAFWYPTPFVRYVLEQKYVSIENVTHVISASGRISAKLMSDCFKGVHAKFPYKTAKRILTQLIGFWGIRQIIRTEGCVTADADMAHAIHNQYPGVIHHQHD